MSNVPAPGEHGGRAHLYGVDLELSASLNPVAPDPTAIFERHLKSVSRYPDAGRATDAMAEVLEVEPELLVLTNGGAEAIALVAAESPIGQVVEPEFALYQRHLQVGPQAPLWMSDPNNPTGRLAAPTETAAVRDEAFYPLATGDWTRGDPDTTVVGSLTKIFSCPGVRMGYIIAKDAELAAWYRKAQPRWSLSGLACDAIPDLLATAQLKRWRDEIAQMRAAMSAALSNRGWHAQPGAANYLWLPNAPGLRSTLFAAGILVRSGASFGFPDGVRIAVPKPGQMDHFIAAIPERVTNG